MRSSAAAFIGEMGLLTSCGALLVADQLVIEVAVLPPIARPNRHAVARAARAAIARQLDISVSSEQESATPPSTIILDR